MKSIEYELNDKNIPADQVSVQSCVHAFTRATNTEWVTPSHHHSKNTSTNKIFMSVRATLYSEDEMNKFITFHMPLLYKTKYDNKVNNAEIW